MNATVVCLIGSVRGGPQAWRSLAANVLRPLSADLALLLPQEVMLPPGAADGLLPHARHIWRVTEPSSPEGWSHFIDELIGTGWRNATLRPNIWGGVSQASEATGIAGATVKGSGAIILSLRLVLLSYLDALARGGVSYRTVVLSRFDHFYACEHPPISRCSFSGQHAAAGHWLRTPFGEQFGGVTDRHSVFPFNSRRAVLSVLPWLASPAGNACKSRGLARRAARASSTMQPCENPEQVLAAYYAHAGVRVGKGFDRVMFTVATNSTEGTRRVGGSMVATTATRWNDGYARRRYLVPPSTPGYDARDPLLCKYRHEYYAAAGWCHIATRWCCNPTRCDAERARWRGIERYPGHKTVW